MKQLTDYENFVISTLRKKINTLYEPYNCLPYAVHVSTYYLHKTYLSIFNVNQKKYESYCWKKQTVHSNIKDNYYIRAKTTLFK